MTTIWHNPRCSKSRQTLALLEDNGHMPKLRMYLKEPPSIDEITTVLRQLSISAADLVRKGESVFKDLGLKDADEDRLIAAMAAHPTLIERPIVVHNDHAKIGRPPESVLDLF